jgi:transcriptional regulator with XRE-family HTH domain
VAVAEPARTCRCGCGGVPKSPRSEFLPGHHSRVAPRPPGGGVGPVRELPLCACGECGERVKSPGSKFQPGHQGRNDEWRETMRQVAAPRRKGEWRKCPMCPKRVWVPSHRLSKWRGCDRVCAAAATRQQAAWNALQTRLLAHLRESGLSFRAFESAAGLPQGTIGAWFRKKGKALRLRTLLRLAELLNIPADQALHEAGGISAEDRRAEQGRELGKNHPEPDVRRERARKLGEAWKGRPRSRESIDKSMTTREESGALAKFKAGAEADAGSVMGKVRRSLYGYLIRTPKPSRTQIDGWAKAVGKKVGLSARAVFAEWEPHLVRQGLIKEKRGGRPRKDLAARRQYMEERLAREDPNRRLPNGFWQGEAQEVSKREDREIDYKTLRDFCQSEGLLSAWKQYAQDVRGNPPL